MNYYIQGNPTNADKIKAAFEAKAIYSNLTFANENYLYYSCDGKVAFCFIGGGLVNIIKTHPDYKELELPIEPKFKVGDWIVATGKCVYLITKIDEFTVILVDVMGDEYEFGVDLLNDATLWTINDAKDGDVLVNAGFIFIFKNIDDGNGVHYYCAYEIRSRKEYEQFHIACFNSLMGRVGNSYTHYTPATKEQSALLFQKMREAGYEWDSNKKELRKIQSHYDITNFQPFDRVLVRQNNDNVWGILWFSRFEDDEFCTCNNVWFNQCIPFNDDTKHLLGTTDMCSEEYINW